MIVAVLVLLTLAAFSFVADRVIGRAFDAVAGWDARRRADRERRVLVSEAAGGSRHDTLTCRTCRRAWPLVSLIGRTRCPGCRAVMVGWQ